MGLRNETPEIITILARLSRLDGNSAITYLCDPTVRHYFRTVDEDKFCGYQNIRMALSYLLTRKIANNDKLGRVSLDIPTLQHYIERSWARNPAKYQSARGDLGGRLKNTRQFIGPAEVQAIWDHLHIPHDTRDYTGAGYHQDVLDFVEHYFQRYIGMANVNVSGDERAVLTAAPPIFMQAPGHSMSIVGLEKLLDGSRNLLILDPDHEPSGNMLAWWHQGGHRTRSASNMLEPYRMSERSWRKRVGPMALTLVM
jgi:hypothetical protein